MENVINICLYLCNMYIYIHVFMCVYMCMCIYRYIHMHIYEFCLFVLLLPPVLGYTKGLGITEGSSTSKAKIPINYSLYSLLSF